MKGVVLAGGTGSRLFPLTAAINKHLLPVFDKPLIHYPIATLMLWGVRDIVIVSGQEHLRQLSKSLGVGTELGLRIEFVVQDRPSGIADGVRAAGAQIEGQHVALILGDNVFFGPGLGRSLSRIPQDDRAHVFLQTAADPRPYAVAEISDDGDIVGIEEKPSAPKSNLVIPGMYRYPPDVLTLIESLSPSERGELEITDLNLEYMHQRLLSAHRLPRGSLWIDAGTPESLLEASNFVRSVQSRLGILVSFLPEIAWRNDWISANEMRTLARRANLSWYAEEVLDRTEVGA